MTAKKGKNTRKNTKSTHNDRKRLKPTAVPLLIVIALLLIGLMRAGVIGLFVYNLERYLVGDMYLLILLLIGGCLFAPLIYKHTEKESENRVVVSLILLMAIVVIISEYVHAGDTIRGIDAVTPYFTNVPQFFTKDAPTNMGGGVLGSLLYGILSFLFARTGTIVVLTLLVILAVMFSPFYPKLIAFFVKPEDLREKEREEKKAKAEEEEQKPSANMWIMMDERKKAKKEEKASFITADTPVLEADIEEVNRHMQNGETVTLKLKPFPIGHVENSVNFNILADENDGFEDTNNLTLMGEKNEDRLADTLKMQLPLSEQENIFIDIDELEDRVVPEEPEETVVRSPYDEEFTDPVADEPDEDVPVYDLPEVPAVEEEEPDPEFDEGIVHRQSVSPVVETASAPAPVSSAIEEDKSSDNKKTTDYSRYRLPNPKIVLDPAPHTGNEKENEEAAMKKGKELIEALKVFNIDSELVDRHIGTAVTQFEIRPEAHVKVSRIINLTDNIKMQLAAKDIRIEAPIPGRNAVGIEIPNQKATPVKMRQIFNTISEKEKQQKLIFYLGKDLLGRTVTCRINKMPHLLIAGATGSGKSVCMNSIICSILMRTRPDEVKLLLVDPKKVEFTPYREIPHLIGPVINDPAEASNALKVIVQVMDERYNIFAANGVRNIEGYRDFREKQPEDVKKRLQPMPYIVVIIDELADLMLVAGKEVEASIQRITQLARAAGIHLIVATQRPSVDVITGIIKANIPSRIAFAVSSSTDSRTILDRAGAERLLGNGDMLYMPIGANSPTRVQGVFITDEEVKAITDHVSSKWAPRYDDAFIRLEGVNDGNGGMEIGNDPLYQEIKEFVIDAQKASTSLLQRHFGIGYNRAARVIDELEATGIIGPAQGSKPRDVYVKRESQ